MAEVQRPYCLALILCEVIHRSPATGQFSMLGTFTRLKSPQSPVPARFAIYFAITDGSGTCKIGVRIVDSASILADDVTQQNDSDLPDMPGEVTFVDPFQIVEGMIHIELSFPRAGVYYCELYAGEDHEVLMSRRIVVSVPETSSGEA